MWPMRLFALNAPMNAWMPVVAETTRQLSHHLMTFTSTVPAQCPGCLKTAGLMCPEQVSALVFLTKLVWLNVVVCVYICYVFCRSGYDNLQFICAKATSL